MYSVLLILLTFSSIKSDTLHLSELYVAAEQNWPTYSQLDRVQEQVDVQLKNVRAAWMPQVFLNASVMYFSEVTEIPFAPPGGSPPSQPHDRYTATLDVQQMLWDGGASRQQARVTELSGSVDQAKVRSELYGLRSQVNEAFFGVLLLDVRLESLELMMGELTERLSAVRVGVEAGSVLQSQADALEAERIRARQQLVELQMLRRTTLRTLSILTGVEVDDSDELLFDAVSIAGDRPELMALQAQQDVLRARKGLLDVRLHPQISAVAQSGLGRPGPNFFDDSLTPFFVVGVQLRWQFFNWGITHREKQLLDLASASIQDQISSFRRGQALQHLAQSERQSALSEQLALDDEVIRLRESVAVSSANQLDSGVITASEYISVLTAAHQARLQRSIRNLEFQKAEATIQFIQFNGE